MYVRTAADAVAVGDTVMFNFELVPPKGEIVPSSVKVHWESSDTSVATELGTISPLGGTNSKLNITVSPTATVSAAVLT